MLRKCKVDDDIEADCNALLNSVMPFAEQMLERYGEFFPFGQAMMTDGQLVAVAMSEGNEHPTAVEVIKSLKEIFVSEAKAGKYRATALAYDVRIRLPTDGTSSDAVAVSLNHRDDYSVIVIVPYSIVNAKPVFAPAFIEKGEADVFRTRR
jgi:hypothetical protein